MRGEILELVLRVAPCSVFLSSSVLRFEDAWRRCSRIDSGRNSTLTAVQSRSPLRSALHSPPQILIPLAQIDLTLHSSMSHESLPMFPFHLPVSASLRSPNRYDPGAHQNSEQSN